MTLTASPTPETLAVAVLYLLWKWAFVEFPSTTRAHPSAQVYVQRAGSRRGEYDTYFPMMVDGILWEKVVIPVYLDDSIQPNVIENQYAAGTAQGTLAARITTLVQAKMIEQGYLPPVS